MVVRMVSIDRGDLVFCKLPDRIKAWNETASVWMERKAGTDPMRWKRLSSMAASLQRPLPTARSEWR